MNEKRLLEMISEDPRLLDTIGKTMTTVSIGVTIKEKFRLQESVSELNKKIGDMNLSKFIKGVLRKYGTGYKNYLLKRKKRGD